MPSRKKIQTKPPTKTSKSGISNLITSRSEKAKRSRHDEEVEELTLLDTEKTAGQRVYETQDIMHPIYELLSRKDLLTMLRVSEDGLSGVAAVLYRTINMDRITKIQKRSIRREIYCNSVRILDISPRPKLEKPVKTNRRGIPIPPTARFPRVANRTTEPIVDPNAFNPKSLLIDYKSWRTIFPNLHTISNEYPNIENADAYTARFEAHDQISVDLRNNIEVWALFDIPNAFKRGMKIPDKPHYPNVDVTRHTIGIDISGVQMEEELGKYWYENSDYNARRRIESRKKWVNSVFDNPNLDKRISEVSILRLNLTQSSLSTEEIITFLQYRYNSETCEPLTKFTLSPVLDLRTLRDLNATHLLGTYLTSLTCTIIIDPTPDVSPQLEEEDGVQLPFRDAQVDIDSIDQSCPSLSRLTVIFSYGHYRSIQRDIEPLKGLKNVRLLTTHFRPLQDPRITARHISGLGADDCVYLQPDLRSGIYMEDYNRIAKACRNPSSAYPNTIGEGVLKSLEAYWIKAYCDLREVDELYIGRVTGGEESIIDLAHQAHEIETRILLMARPLLSVIN